MHVGETSYLQIGMVSTLGGGVGRFTNRLIEGLLIREDIQIGLFLIDRRLQFKLDSNKRITIKYSASSSSPFLSKIMTVLNLSVKKLPFDLVHCHYISNAALLKRYNGNVILTMHGFPRPEVETRLIDRAAYSFEQWCISLLPPRVKIVTVSQYVKKNIKERYGFDAEVIYLGIDCDKYTPTSDKNVLKNTSGFSKKRVILYVGRLHPIKDPITLINAYYEVTKRITDTMLVFVGNGPLREKILKLGSYYDIPVRIIDSLDDTRLIPLYQCSDLFVHPSIGDSSPAVLAEAMACGCACLANTSGGCPELLDMKDLLVEPNNPMALAEMMIYLLQNPQESERASRYLRDRAINMFSLEKMTRSYYNLYKSVIKQ